MNVKKVVGLVLGIGIGGALVVLNRALPQKSVDVVNSEEQVITKPEEMFGGVKLSELNKIARSLDPQNWVSLDEFGFLVLHYKSNRGHQTFKTQLEIDDASRLVNLNGGPSFPGQRYSHADEFVKRANDLFIFSKSGK